MTLDKPRHWELVTHIRKGGRYRVVNIYAKMKCNGVWHPAIEYRPVDRLGLIRFDQPVYIREVQDFMENLERIG